MPSCSASNKCPASIIFTAPVTFARQTTTIIYFSGFPSYVTWISTDFKNQQVFKTTGWTFQVRSHWVLGGSEAMSWQAVRVIGRNTMLLGFVVVVLLGFVLFCFFLQTNKFEDGEIHLREHEHIRPSDYISLTRQYSVTTANVLSIELYRHERWFLLAPAGTGLSCNFLMDKISSQHWNPVSVWIWSCQHQPPWKSRCLPE